jgi:hypothetical protein
LRGIKVLLILKNTKEEARSFILSLVGVPSIARYEKYLGFPALIGRSKVGAFFELKGWIIRFFG